MLKEPTSSRKDVGVNSAFGGDRQETEKISQTANPELQGERLIEDDRQQIIERASNLSASRDGGNSSDGAGLEQALYPINIAAD